MAHDRFVKLFLAARDCIESFTNNVIKKSAFFSGRGLPTRDTSCEGAAGGSPKAGGETEEGQSWSK